MKVSFNDSFTAVSAGNYVDIHRLFSNEFQTLGLLSVFSPSGVLLFRCCCLELSYKYNAPLISCINIGVYDGAINNGTAKFNYKHIDITNVAGRSGIKVHALNFIDSIKVESQGCIGVGTAFVDIDFDGLLDIVNSKQALSKLLLYLPNKFKITIH